MQESPYTMGKTGKIDYTCITLLTFENVFEVSVISGAV
jgi:hypothetical protein